MANTFRETIELAIAGLNFPPYIQYSAALQNATYRQQLVDRLATLVPNYYKVLTYRNVSGYPTSPMVGGDVTIESAQRAIVCEEGSSLVSMATFASFRVAVPSRLLGYTLVGTYDPSVVQLQFKIGTADDWQTVYQDESTPFVLEPTDLVSMRVRFGQFVDQEPVDGIANKCVLKKLLLTMEYV